MINTIKGWGWLDLDEIGSTNDEAIRQSAAPLAEKFVITAKKQNQGRGRRGRSWIAVPGNLFSSLVLKVMLQDIGQMVFVVSLSLLEAIKQLNPKADVKLKWPNDVLVNDKKISGILLEKGADDYMVIGIGVNIVGAPELTEASYESVSLKNTGIEIGRLDFLELYLECFDRNYHLWQNSGFAPIKEKWLANAKGLGEEIVVNLENGKKTGRFSGVDENGLLLLETSGQIEKIYAGDVFIKRK